MICVLLPLRFQRKALGNIMSDNNTANKGEIAENLSRLREQAGIKQAELARQITWSPASLSRVESGERDISQDELQLILKAIGTQDASIMSEALTRQWQVLPRPPLDHLDQDLLWEAEQVAQKLQKLREQPDVRSAFDRRLAEYLKELKNTANLILNREHKVAVIGSIGIGKSTLICRVASLEVPSKDGGFPMSVLEAGAGGITVCEVHVRTGPAIGMLIEPRSEEEIREDVTDFAEHIYRAVNSTNAKSAATNSESQGLSKEIERAVRNMANLRVRREKNSDGKTLRRDEAKELAAQFKSVRELVLEMLTRMELHRRDRRDIWYDPKCGKPPLLWLKETFEKINNGRHPEFALPKRMDVIIPEKLLGLDDLDIEIIDTKGIDRTATRADLENHLDDTHTLTILCSGFNNAPAAEPRLLLERAIQTGVKNLENRAAIVVLPRSDEALAMKDESGYVVESIEEGYELKGEQVSLALEPLGLQNLAVDFFDARQGETKSVKDFLVNRISNLRNGFCSQMKEIVENTEALLGNYEQEQVQEIIRQAATMISTWINKNTPVPHVSDHIQDSLMDEIAKVYASTLRASVRREGEWSNLSYSHHLGFGARKLAVSALGQKVSGFTELCETLIANPDYKEAEGLIKQSERLLLSTYEELLRKIQLMGHTAFKDELKEDSTFWRACDEEWGEGPGYKDRVASHNRDWFDTEARRDLQSQITSVLEKEWSLALKRVGSLLSI